MDNFVLIAVLLSSHQILNICTVTTLILSLYCLTDIIHDESEVGDVSTSSDAIMRGRSLDSIPSTFTNGSSSPGPNSESLLSLLNARLDSSYDRCYLLMLIWNSVLLIYLLYLGLDPDVSPDEQEEKARLISQVLELQNTLDGKYILHVSIELEIMLM